MYLEICIIWLLIIVSYWLFPSRRESSGSGGCGAAPSSGETWSDGDGGMAMVIMRDGDGDAGGWSSWCHGNDFWFSRGILPSNSMLPTMVFPHEYCIFYIIQFNHLNSFHSSTMYGWILWDTMSHSSAIYVAMSTHDMCCTFISWCPWCVRAMPVLAGEEWAVASHKIVKPCWTQ